MAARYQDLSPAFPSAAVDRLDAVFGDLSRHSVTTPEALPAAMPEVFDKLVASRTGVEPVSPP